MEPILNNYLVKMEKYLKALPAAERIDIVNELKSEMIELSDKGISGEQIVNRLGNPKVLARAYLADEIGKMKKFSWKKFAMVFSFYSYASIGGMFILPITSCLAVAFIISGVACPLAGLVKFIAHFCGKEMPYLTLNIGNYSASAIAFLPISIGLGIVLFLLGWAFWKLTVLFIKSVGKHKRLKDRIQKEN